MDLFNLIADVLVAAMLGHVGVLLCPLLGQPQSEVLGLAGEALERNLERSWLLVDISLL